MTQDEGHESWEVYCLRMLAQCVREMDTQCRWWQWRKWRRARGWVVHYARRVTEFDSFPYVTYVESGRGASAPVGMRRAKHGR